MTEERAIRRGAELPVACDRMALGADQRRRKLSLQERLRADLKEVRELDDGYALRHSPEPDVLLAMAEFVALERLCYPFLSFEINLEPGGEPLWIRMRGERGAKGVLQAELGRYLGREPEGVREEC